MTDCHRCHSEIQGEPILLDSVDDVGWPVTDKPHCPLCAVTFERDIALEAHWGAVAATFEPYREAIPAAHRGGLDIDLPDDLSWNGEPWALLLTGDNGRGKSWLAARVLKELVVTNRESRFAWASVMTLDRRLKLGFKDNTSAALLEECCTLPLFVLDDLRQIRQTEFSEDWVRALLSAREEQRLPTILTVDRTLKTLDPMLQSRLQEPAVKVYHLNGKDQRGR